ncbi:MAG TPA: rhodanese-like domain-containing protein [Polyangiaceae bacterium]
MRTLVLFTALAIAGCQADKTSAPPSESAQNSTTNAQTVLPDRDPALAHRLVERGAVLVDVRTPEEYATRHVDGAINIPVDEIESRIADVSKGDTSKAVVVYCHSGNRAARAKKILVEHGYSQVTNLGGIDDWDKK